MIKKFIVSVFVLLFGFVSFSNSEWVIRQIGNYSTSTIDDSIDLNVVNKGQLLSQRFGQTKRMLAFSSNNSDGRVYFFWSNNQIPYYLINYGIFKNQGFLKNYFICPEIISGSSYNPYSYDCTIHEISSDTFAGEVGGFLQSIDSLDYWGYNIESERCHGSPLGVLNLLCFSSSEYHKSLCFGASYDIAQNCNLLSFGDLTTYNLGSSLRINYSGDFTFVDDGFLNTPPGFTPINKIDGSSSIGNNVSLTGNLMYNSCTKGYILNKLDGILGDQFCYAGTYDTGLIDNNFNGNTYIYDYGLNYRDLYKLSKSIGPYYSSYNDWYLGHYDSIKRYKLGQISQNPFIGEPVAVYSYFNNLYSNYGIDVADLSTKEFSSYGVLNYCNLLFSDSSISSAYTGQYFQYLCDSLNFQDGSIDVSTGIIGDPEESFEVLPPGFEYSNNPSSGIIVSVDWSGTLSGNTNQNFDGKNFINDFYQKLQSVFQKPINSATGIIPGYILVFLVAIILFRFIQH